MTLPNDFGRFFERIDSLTLDMVDLKTSLVKTRESVDRVDERAGQMRKVGWASLGTGLVSLIVAALALIGAGNTRQDADDRADEQAQARVSACIQFNAQRQELRETFVGSLVAIMDLNPPDTPEEDQRRSTIVSTYRGTVEAQLPYRDCSDGGIDRYLSNPPADPNDP